ncbi:hypothetical protein GCK72_001842 [Caenorhabditis remanei]|uniref:Uncharacterized protein n=1 Tax=Caenorhabditis remanei TaxID=31234 RepID=A0A6A5HQZ5_CAERE|nr:hypothetical protein GCK72_001842 [Caenorhabditis remanei]KAF1770025.1 hypothetical protein GCK72_001842 [Caenorhabditis remanei]
MDDSMNEDEYPQAKLLGKYEKAHKRSIIALGSFCFGAQTGVISISHDSSKLWIMYDKRAEESVSLDEKMNLYSWKTAVQSAEVSEDGQYLVVIAMDAQVYETELITSVKLQEHDNEYLEATFCAVSPRKDKYITASYSGYLSEFKSFARDPVRREPYPNVKQISHMKFSRDAKFLAIGHLDGGIDLLYAEDFKNYHKYEVHSMRIRKIEFLPGDDRFLTACDDRLIKLNSVADFSHETDPSRSTKAIRVYSAHDAPVIGLTIDVKSGGTRFASSSSSSQIFVWHIELATPIMSIVNDHTSAVTALSFSPSSRHLISGGDDAMICVYGIPGVGEESPEHEHAQEEEELSDEHDDQQENEPPSGYSQSAEQSDFANHNEDTEATPTAQYQEYNPYAEPRTPPQEENDDDLGDYVYNTTTQRSDEPTSASHDEYNPAS